MNFGVYLAHLRDAAGLKKADLARRLNISPSHIGSLEKGIANPPPTERLEQICAILNVTGENKKNCSISPSRSVTRKNCINSRKFLQ